MFNKATDYSHFGYYLRANVFVAKMTNTCSHIEIEVNCTNIQGMHSFFVYHGQHYFVNTDISIVTFVHCLLMIVNSPSLPCCGSPA